jgi:hypothetical protein
MRLAPALIALFVTSGSALAQCLEWSSGFHAPGTESSVNAWTNYDDGTGTSIYAGGLFEGAGGAPGSSGVARWTGSDWAGLGTGVEGQVRAFAEFDYGNGPELIAGGWITSAGGQPANDLAAWDGTQWTAIPGTPSTNGVVYALEVFDDGSGPALFVGGGHVQIAGVTVNRIAKWDGLSWSAVGNGFDDYVSELEIYDDGSGPALYAAGRFTTSGATPTDGLAKWDGVSWTAVGGGPFNGPILDLDVFDDGSGPRLVVGGGFDDVGGVSANSVAAWDGTQWSALGSGVDGAAWTLAPYDDGSGPALYAGGPIEPFSNVAKWDGTSWAPLGVGADHYVEALMGFDAGNGPTMFVGGRFLTAGGLTTRHAARWDGSWAHMGAGGAGLGGPFPSFVRNLREYDDGTGSALWVGGDFEWAGQAPALNIGKWDGSSWTVPGGGFDDAVWDTEVFDDGNGPALYAGGDFNTPAHVARWDGTGWTQLGAGVANRVIALEVFDDGSGPALFAGGSFQNAGTSGARRFAKWDGASWSDPTAGAPPSARVRALASWDDGSGPALFLGGDFVNAGGVVAQYVAKWDGTSWSEPGGGLDGRVHAFAIHDDGNGEALYATGGFVHAGGNVAWHVAKWDGTAWSDVAGGFGRVGRAIASYDPGAGNGKRLYIGTDDALYHLEGGWIEEPVKGSVHALCEFADGNGAWPPLYVGGDFSLAGGNYFNAGGTESALLARWSDGCACEGSSYCTAGTTANGCQATISSVGAASRSSASGFDVTVTGAEGARDGLFFFGTNDAQAAPWGNGTSFQCVVPPVQRTGMQSGGGGAGACNGTFAFDFNAWMTANAQKAPEPSSTAYLQCWYRDPSNTSNQTTSLSNALRFSVCP